MCASTHLEPLPTLRPPQPGPRYWQLNAGVQNFKRSFAGECKRCDEMARRLDFLLNEVIAAGLTPLPRDEEAHLAPIPDLDAVRAAHFALPSESFPSDHVCLVADLEWS